MPNRHHHDQTHEDAVAANPFTARNAIIGVAITLVGAGIIALVSFFCNTILDRISDTHKDVLGLSTNVQDVQRTLAVHGVTIDAMSDDMRTLKGTCVDITQVDDRIRTLVPQIRTSAHGGESMVRRPLAVSTNIDEGNFP